MDDYRCRAYISFTESVGNMTALHLACLHNRTEVIGLLLQAGAGNVLLYRAGRSKNCIGQADITEYAAASVNQSQNRENTYFLNLSYIHNEIIGQARPDSYSYYLVLPNDSR